MAKPIGGSLVSVACPAPLCRTSPKPGMGTAILCIAAIGFLHRSLDEAHSTILSRWVHILCAIFFIAFQLVPNSNATFDIAVNMGSSSSRRRLGNFTFARRWATPLRRAARRRAGFQIEDLTPCNKYVDPAPYSNSRRLLTGRGTGAKLRLITLGLSVPPLSLAPKNHRKVFATAV